MSEAASGNQAGVRSLRKIVTEAILNRILKEKLNFDHLIRVLYGKMQED